MGINYSSLFIVIQLSMLLSEISLPAPETAVQRETEAVQEQNPLDSKTGESDYLYYEYKEYKSLELIHHSTEHGAIAEDSLRKMLKKDEEIMLALYRSADEQERELVRESYLRTLEQFG